MAKLLGEFSVLVRSLPLREIPGVSGFFSTTFLSCMGEIKHELEWLLLITPANLDGESASGKLI